MQTAIPSIDELVARRISKRRRELHLSLASVARGCGVSLQQIHRYEIGANTISVTMLWRIAKMLKTEPAYFFEDFASQAPAPPSYRPIEDARPRAG